jgi:hypothetical protein
MDDTQGEQESADAAHKERSDEEFVDPPSQPRSRWSRRGATVKEPNSIAPRLDNALGKLEQRRQKKKEYGVWRATSPQSEQEESGFMQRTTRRCDFFRKKLVVVRRKEAVLGRRLARTKMTLTIVGCSSTNLPYRLKVPFCPFASINLPIPQKFPIRSLRARSMLLFAIFARPSRDSRSCLGALRAECG